VRRARSRKRATRAPTSASAYPQPALHVHLESDLEGRTRPERTEHSQLARALERSAAVCRQTIVAYLKPAEAETSEFARSLLAAVAAIEVVTSHARRTPDERDTALAIASTLCSAAADACRRSGLDLRLRRAAAACDEAAALCDRGCRQSSPGLRA
jgi:hypothetical protein